MLFFKKKLIRLPTCNLYLIYKCTVDSVWSPESDFAGDFRKILGSHLGSRFPARSLMEPGDGTQRYHGSKILNRCTECSNIYKIKDFNRMGQLLWPYGGALEGKNKWFPLEHLRNNSIVPSPQKLVISYNSYNITVRTCFSWERL